MNTPENPRRRPPAAPRDGSPKVHGSAVLEKAVLGRFTEIKERVKFLTSELGDYSHVERHSEVMYARIGKFCAIAADVRINALGHPMERVSQHKITYRPNEYFTGAKIDKSFREWRQGSIVDIGNDVWVGHGAIIMPGLKIGHGAVIAAGAVVTKDVPPHVIVGGVAARLLKRRFTEKISERIIALGWWDWEHDRLAAAIADMQALGAEAFLEKHGG